VSGAEAGTGRHPARPRLAGGDGRTFRRTRIVATLGPASQSAEVVEALLLAGVNVARVNFSHGTRADHGRQIELVRSVAARLDRNVAVLQDLQGPKIRVGRVADGEALLVAGASVRLQPDDGALGTAERLGVSLATLGSQLAPDTVILIDDGRVRLRVVAVDGEAVHCVVEVGGVVRDRKGVNVPGVTLDVPSLTEKDVADIEYGAECGVDLVALSFVRSAADVHQLRQRLQSLGSGARIIAKIEKHEALAHIDAIIEASDGVMVARGDLGVEIPPEQVPRWQKAIIRRATARARAVITATQMLESMTAAPTPTRAEASDVANAVYDGTTAVMLSGETAVGAYPVESVATMARIVATVEEDLFGAVEGAVSAGASRGAVGFPASAGSLPTSAPRPSAGSRPSAGGELAAPDTTEAISRAACALAADLGAAAILTPTRTGATARQVSRHRPGVPVIATTPSEGVRSQLALEWGVVPMVVAEASDTDETIRVALRAARTTGLVTTGDLVVVTCGALVNVPGSTNVIKVERV